MNPLLLLIVYIVRFFFFVFLLFYFLFYFFRFIFFFVFFFFFFFFFFFSFFLFLFLFLNISISPHLPLSTKTSPPLQKKNQKKKTNKQENNLPEAKKQISQILRNLPECHAIPLRLLFQFLSHVSSLSNINFMTQRNLAICFGPSVLRSCSDDPLKMMDQYDSKV